MAAMTCSIDKQAVRYMAGVETNGSRVEMITSANIEQFLLLFVQRWMEHAGEGRMPVNCIYFRDGVSEGQYQHVINQELKDIKAVFTHFAEKNGQQLKVCCNPLVSYLVSRR